MSSCSMMEMEGTPIPCCDEERMHLYVILEETSILWKPLKYYLHLERALAPLCTCRSGRFPHIYLWLRQGFQAVWVPGGWTGQMLSCVLNFHRHTQTMRGRERGDLCFSSFWNYFLNQFLTNLNIPKHLWEIVSLCAQAEVVENVLLHGVQVGISHLDEFSASKSVDMS